MPGPVNVGSKVPAIGSVIPVPLQVPPGSAAVKLKGTAVSQNGPAHVIVASATAVPLLTVTVPEDTQPVLSVTSTV